MLAVKLNLSLNTGNIGRAASIFVSKKRYFLENNKTFHTFEGQGSGRYKETQTVQQPDINDLKRRCTLLTSVGLQHGCPSTRKYSSESLPERPDVFGDLGDRKYERKKPDKDEEKEDQFLKNEAKLPRRLTKSPGQYADMIKKHIDARDLKAAIAVLDKIKNDRNKPNDYMYNLLIRAFAMQGDSDRCFRLYNRMKKQDLKPNGATYTSLLNACANSRYTEKALQQLNDLRQALIEKGINLNEANYNAMIKAYGRHGKLLEAFTIVDEMRDKKLNIDADTFSFLLQGTISDKEAGFRHALVAWHLMLRQHLKPTIYIYNLLLRSARDCKLGDLKANDFLIPGAKQSQVLLLEADRPDLLATPPVLSTLAIPTSKGKSAESEFSDLEPTENPMLKSQVKDSSYRNEANDYLPAVSSSSISSLIARDAAAAPSENNLLLLGGFDGFVRRMENDGVKPDLKTLTLLLDLVPITISAEKAVMKYAKSKGIELDVDFYNMLIKKRSMRFDYAAAKEVLHYFQRKGLKTSIVTWGVLALGCRSPEDARELIQGMEVTGHTLNTEIVGTLMNGACRRSQFNLVVELMLEMRSRGLKANQKMFDILDTFQRKAGELNRKKPRVEFVHQPFWQNGFRKFNLMYATWREEMGGKPKPSKKEPVKSARAI